MGFVSVLTKLKTIMWEQTLIYTGPDQFDGSHKPRPSKIIKASEAPLPIYAWHFVISSGTAKKFAQQVRQCRANLRNVFSLSVWPTGIQKSNRLPLPLPTVQVLVAGVILPSLTYGLLHAVLTSAFHLYCAKMDELCVSTHQDFGQRLASLF